MDLPFAIVDLSRKGVQLALLDEIDELYQQGETITCLTIADLEDLQTSGYITTAELKGLKVRRNQFRLISTDEFCRLQHILRADELPSEEEQQEQLDDEEQQEQLDDEEQQQQQQPVFQPLPPPAQEQQQVQIEPEAVQTQQPPLTSPPSLFVSKPQSSSIPPPILTTEFSSPIILSPSSKPTPSLLPHIKQNLHPQPPLFPATKPSLPLQVKQSTRQTQLQIPIQPKQQPLQWQPKPLILANQEPPSIHPPSGAITASPSPSKPFEHPNDLNPTPISEHHTRPSSVFISDLARLPTDNQPSSPSNLQPKPPWPPNESGLRPKPHPPPSAPPPSHQPQPWPPPSPPYPPSPASRPGKPPPLSLLPVPPPSPTLTGLSSQQMLARAPNKFRPVFGPHTTDYHFGSNFSSGISFQVRLNSSGFNISGGPYYLEHNFGSKPCFELHAVSKPNFDFGLNYTLGQRTSGFTTYLGPQRCEPAHPFKVSLFIWVWTPPWVVQARSSSQQFDPGKVSGKLRLRSGVLKTVRRQFDPGKNRSNFSTSALRARQFSSVGELIRVSY